MANLERILELSNKYEGYILDIRRKIHQNPELSFKEFDTSKLVLEELSKINLNITAGLAETGIIGELEGRELGKTILVRADMDALPIDENNNLEFKSKNPGIMHACGHDVHTANLVGVAKILSEMKDEFKGTVKFLFQPGEERGGGAKKVLDEIKFQYEEINEALALHIMPIKKGTILLNNNNITAYSNGFTIKVFGKTAHTSKPQDGIDAINIASHIVVSLNSILSKYLEPHDFATFSIGRIQGGRSNNIVADYTELNGMIRAVTKNSRDIIREKLISISEGIAESFGGKAKVEVREGYPSIINNTITTEKIRDIFNDNYLEIIQDIDFELYKENNPKKNIIDIKPLLTADDFGFIAEQIPSTYFMVGTGDYAPNHSSKFFVDEKYIKLCTRLMVLGILKLLEV